MLRNEVEFLQKENSRWRSYYKELLSIINKKFKDNAK